MSFLDRFTSKKGKAAPKAEKAAPAKKADAKKEAFANVPSGKEAPVEKSTPVRKESTDQAFRILLRPVVTEKSSRLSKSQQYVFMINGTSTKTDVRNAVQQVYGVRPTDVTIINLPGKIVRYGRSYGRQAARRKAVITLPAGKSIDVFSA